MNPKQSSKQQHRNCFFRARFFSTPYSPSIAIIRSGDENPPELDLYEPNALDINDDSLDVQDVNLIVRNFIAFQANDDRLLGSSWVIFFEQQEMEMREPDISLQVFQKQISQLNAMDSVRREFQQVLSASREPNKENSRIFSLKI